MRFGKYVVSLIILVLIAVFLILNSSGVPSPSDNSILTQRPCKIPCWHNLFPKKTTLDTARASLATDDFVQALSEYKSTFQQGRVDLFWGNGNRLIFINDILTLMIIRPNINFSLQDILDRYGMPLGTQIKYLPSSRIDGQTITMSLYYPHDGLMVDFEVFNGDSRTKEKFDLNTSLKGISFSVTENTTSLEEFIPKTVGGNGIISPDYLKKYVILGLPDLTKNVVKFTEPDLNSNGSVPLIVTITPR